MEKYTINVEGMMCNNCTTRVEKALRETNKITNVKADYVNGTVEVEGELSKEQASIIIDDCGFDVV